ncbi:hypothetical protein T4A_6422 [Trichinella pseudospiralis]|uniref:Uncharacterized protein n=1 Tax=Trichinella pseudospiralis TaxID=6337 RepID=A0A0V1DWV3_TRIPS|nr:hypothetical protein T4A_6422 [Trichinella pseudospiralis]
MHWLCLASRLEEVIWHRVMSKNEKGKNDPHLVCHWKQQALNERLDQWSQLEDELTRSNCEQAKAGLLAYSTPAASKAFSSEWPTFWWSCRKVQPHVVCRHRMQRCSNETRTRLRTKRSRIERNSKLGKNKMLKEKELKANLDFDNEHGRFFPTTTGIRTMNTTDSTREEQEEKRSKSRWTRRSVLKNR